MNRVGRERKKIYAAAMLETYSANSVDYTGDQCIALLHVSAAFDSPDHSILTSPPKTLGISGIVAHKLDS